MSNFFSYVQRIGRDLRNVFGSGGGNNSAQAPAPPPPQQQQPLRPNRNARRRQNAAETEANYWKERGDRKFVNDEACEDFLCPICHDVYYEPVKITCGHFFCKRCIHDWLKRKNSCPVCRNHFAKKDLKNDREKKDQVDNLIVGCSFSDCLWQGKLKDFKNHVKNCTEESRKLVSALLKTGREEGGIEKSEEIKNDNGKRNFLNGPPTPRTRPRTTPATILTFTSPARSQNSLFNDRQNVQITNSIFGSVSNNGEEMAVNTYENSRPLRRHRSQSILNFLPRRNSGPFFHIAPQDPDEEREMLQIAMAQSRSGTPPGGNGGPSLENGGGGNSGNYRRIHRDENDDPQNEENEVISID